MCFMGWFYEILAILSAFLTPILHKLEIPNLCLIDAIFMFVVIPLIHLLNDEETKAIILEENWYEGLRYMLGIYKEKAPQNGRRAVISEANDNK